MVGEPKQVFADAQARGRVVNALDESQIVEAAAGTGKTRILVDRIVLILREGLGELGGMVAVTFTEKAAGELKLRVREGIEAARLGAPAEQAAVLERALEQLEDAHVGTIHGFCTDLLREYPVEAGVDPDFSVQSDEVVGTALFDEVFRRWFDDMRHDLPSGMRRVLRRQPERGKPPTAQLLEAANRLREHRDLTRPWSLPEFDLGDAVDALCDEHLLAAAQAARDAIAARAASLDSLLPLLTLADQVQRAGDRSDRDHEQIEARLWEFKRPERLGGGRTKEQVRLRKELIELFERLDQQIAQFRDHSGAQLAALLQRELRGCVDAYEHEKQVVGHLDFMDLLLKTRSLLTTNRRVRAELQQRFTHVFIDEFQDTDPLQAEILLLLCSDDAEETRFDEIRPVSGKLFVVGDPKQSIYRFRRAEVELYERLKQRLAQRQDVSLLQLSTSFRAVPEIQQAVNTAFEPLMCSNAEGAQPDYVALAPYREPIVDQPAIVALPLHDVVGHSGRPTKEAARRQEPEVVAAWIEWVLRDSGWKVSARGSAEGLEPVAPHDICLLFRYLRGWGGDLTRPYVQALERRNIPHSVVGGRSFFVRPEVESLVTALRVVEWPNDELSVYALLRGPLFGFDDETLLVYARSGGRFHTRRPGDPSGARQVLAALSVLGDLHPGRNHRPLPDTVSRLLAATRCASGFALRHAGDQAVNSLLRIQDLARRFEASEALSFRAFVQYLESQMEAETADADLPIVEEGSGGVRVMTVHKAKGLEFPLVVLADVTCPMPKRASQVTHRGSGLHATQLCGCKPLELQQHHDAEVRRERAEALRLLYVAATRARDLLAVPMVSDLPDSWDSWLAPLQPVLGATQSAVDQPTGLGLAAPPEPKALRHLQMINAEGELSASSRQRYEAWREDRRALLQRAGEPSCLSTSATAAAHDPTLFTPELTFEAPRVEILRVHGPGGPGRQGSDALRFGSLVHEILEWLPLGPKLTEESVVGTARLSGRLRGASDAEVTDAAGVVWEALRHPLMHEARHASQLFREAPVLMRLDIAGEPPLIVEGIVDLVFVDGAGRMWAIDYKTDGNPPEERVGAYRRQVALYQIALGGALNRPVHGALLFV